MRDNWKDPAFARQWDDDPITYNPTRPEQLDILLSIIEAEVAPGKPILDVGFGSGRVSERILERIPGSIIVGIDSSDAMMGLANDRLGQYAGRYTLLKDDLTRWDTLPQLAGRFPIAFSVQTLHNLEPEDNRRALQAIHQTLEPGGLFLLMDRIRPDAAGLYSAYKALWRRLERLYDARIEPGETLEENYAKLAERGDLPVTLEQNLSWLRDIGFEAACLHLHANRALIAARKSNRY
jgi:ubiquinone/menaquinone biosynthesis C-methylase UbiE